ncbi:MAG: hypothetical protein KDJ65_27630 [Anaerolineae bacterium]|nr:hypothetical protein [Anaerolineae bacterium]
MNEIGFAKLIQHPKIKLLIEDAERELNSGNYLEAVKKSNACISFTIKELEDYFFHRYTDVHSIFAPSFSKAAINVSQNNTPIEINEQNKNKLNYTYDLADELQFFQLVIHNSLRNVHEILLWNVLSLSYVEYLKFRKIAGYVQYNNDMSEITYHRQNKNFDKKDAEFVLAYCINTIIEIESRVGNIEAPSF